MRDYGMCRGDPGLRAETELAGCAPVDYQEQHFAISAAATRDISNAFGTGDTGRDVPFPDDGTIHCRKIRQRLFVTSERETIHAPRV